MKGILCIDKPQNMTSFSCCAVVRRLLHEKAGHAGTLDPMASGVLPVMVGSATRALPFLPSSDKQYAAELRLGYVSDTLDVWGNVRPTGAALPSRDEIVKALEGFRGEIEQIPPMMSAIKKDGVRLYQLARQGIEVQREPRKITIYELTLTGYDESAATLSLDCRCSSGTYIRTLCDDLGKILGCGAVMTALRRTWAAGFSLDTCLTPEQARTLASEGLLEQRLIPLDSVFRDDASVTVTGPQAQRFMNGGALALERLTVNVSGRARMRVYSPEGVFLGLGIPKDGQLAVLRLF